jgi:hypothetical protein
MKDRSVVPLSWGTVALAILPGLLIVGAHSGLLGWFLPGVQQAVVQNDLIPVYIALAIVIVGLVVERWFAVWSFPSLGIVLLEMPGLIVALLALFGNPQSSFWQSAPPVLMLIGLIALAVFSVYQTHRRRPIHVPRSGWMLVGSLVLVSLIFVIVEAPELPSLICERRRPTRSPKRSTPPVEPLWAFPPMSSKPAVWWPPRSRSRKPGGRSPS